MRMKTLLASACLSYVTMFASVSADEHASATPIAAESQHVDAYTLRGEKHFVHDFAPRTDSGLIRAVIEIPAGTTEKWEVDKSDGQLKWEFKNGSPRVVRFLPYPGNYGMIPRTMLPKEAGGDGDPLDVLVLAPAVPRGSVIEVKLIGVLKLLDGGEQDDKLLAVLPGTALAGVSDLLELKTQFPGVLEIVEQWMTGYKGPSVMQSRGFGDRADALRVLDHAIRAYERNRKVPATGCN